jgi:hypothetical protein
VNGTFETILKSRNIPVKSGICIPRICTNNQAHAVGDLFYQETGFLVVTVQTFKLSSCYSPPKIGGLDAFLIWVFAAFKTGSDYFLLLDS